MLAALKDELRALLRRRIHDLYGIDHDPVVETPPRRELGDLAFPAALHLARELKQNPRDTASRLVDGLDSPAGVREIRIEGAGFLNVFLERPRFAAGQLRQDDLLATKVERERIIVEHTNINPNKAAHIGHLRNAVLGDVLVSVLRRLGHTVETQNYIDDTGVQLADVVVGFVDLRGLSYTEVEALPEPFDYTCWDLYSEVGRWYEEDATRQALRRQTLHELESGSGARAELGRLVSRRIVSRHLGTMRRLGIGYDLLTHESAILGLDFFTQAFDKLEASGAIHLEEEGKNAGCWVMPLGQSEEFAGLEDPDKVIVRSDGTVTYVGKDIAYQMWKFGLLGRDFEYRLWPEEGIWETTAAGDADHPPFGRGDRVINVIDARQSYLQKIVRAGLEALGHDEAAQRSIHFAYEMVTLSPKTAAALGFAGDDGDEGRSLEMSGRKGIGVKADDLIDQLTARSREEIASRNRDLEPGELDQLAAQIATGALRFFMTRATTTRVIAFDLEDALSFEGETGPYLQYSLVRARNICRKLVAADLPAEVSAEEVERQPPELWSDDLWDLVLTVAQGPEKLVQTGGTLELSLLARHALDLAQRFNAVYHKHPILNEEDPTLRAVRLAATQVFRRGLEDLCGLLGVPTPERM